MLLNTSLRVQLGASHLIAPAGAPQVAGPCCRCARCSPLTMTINHRAATLLCLRTRLIADRCCAGDDEPAGRQSQVIEIDIDCGQEQSAVAAAATHQPGNEALFVGMGAELRRISEQFEAQRRRNHGRQTEAKTTQLRAHWMRRRWFWN